MNVHKSAGLTPRGREILISRLERGEHPIDVATAMGVSTSTVYKWKRCHRAQGIAGLRGCRPIMRMLRVARWAHSRVCTRETLEQTIRTGTPPKFLDLNKAVLARRNAFPYNRLHEHASV